MAQATVGPAEPDVIDLGEVGWRTPGDGATRLSWGGWRGRTLPPRAWRALSAALIVLAVMASGVAAGTPEPALGRPLWTGRTERGFGLGASTLYVPNDFGVTAVSTLTGEVRWHAPGRELEFEMETVGGLVLFVGLAPTGVADQETVVVDGVNGQVLTRHLGTAVGGIDPHHVLVYEVPSACAAQPTPGCESLVNVNVASGREEWRLPLRSTTWGIDADPTGVIRRLLLEDEDGRATIHAADTGRALGALAIDLTPTTDIGSPLITYFFTSDGLLVAQGLADGIRVSLYRIGAAEPTWSVRVDGPPLANDEFFYVTQVGDVIAVFYGGRTSLLDPATGRRRFGLPATALTDVGGGRLLAEAYNTSQPPALLDARTGEKLVTFPGSQVIYFHGTKGRALLSRSGSDRILIELVDLEGRVLLLDDVRGANVSCRGREDILACTDDSRTLRVWRLPEPPNR